MRISMFIMVDTVWVNFSGFPMPISYVIKREAVPENTLVKMDNIETKPPTSEYIPKSLMPKTDKISLLVYNPINRAKNNLIFRYTVFFIIRLFSILFLILKSSSMTNL